MELHSFQAFADTADAVAAASATLEGKVSSQLQAFLKKKRKIVDNEMLAVADKSLAVSLKESEILSNLKIVHDNKTQELFRGVRQYMGELFDASDEGISADDIKAMQLGLSHSLSRYKLKFSADKVDTMVIQAVGLLDELDKEINTYAMRVKEWYGWHFPELQGIVGDNASYAKLVLECGLRPNFAGKDLSSILEDETIEASVKESAEISMGTEIAELDIINIQSLADQVLSMTEYRSQLFEYLKNRMNAIAPNLTVLVGELVGARLIAHAGSLMNLAKQPASTVQILGAEKALFRALKTKHATPKYGLIYHASLIGQAAPKNKGKISRVLAAKAALAIRVDALTDEADGDAVDTSIGYEGRAKVEARLRQLEGGSFASSTSNLTAKKVAKYDPVAAKMPSTPGYNDASDMVLDVGNGKDEKEDVEENGKKDKKQKKRKAESQEDEEGNENSKSDKKKKKKRKSEGGEEDEAKQAKKAKKLAKKKKS